MLCICLKDLDELFALIQQIIVLQAFRKKLVIFSCAEKQVVII